MRSAFGPVGARNSSGPITRPAYSAQRALLPSTVEIGVLFRDLRRILRLSLPELAARLGTHIEVVTALERGDIRRLPPWPETVRIVTDFTGMARIDPRPVLAIIRDHMEDGPNFASPGNVQSRITAMGRAAAVAAGRVVETTRSAASVAWGARQAMAQSWIAGAAHMDVEEGARHPMAWLGRTGILVLLVLSLTLVAYVARSTGVEGALAELRAPIGRLVNKAQDHISRHTGADELQWIDVDDPRSRRTDRLEANPR